MKALPIALILLAYSTFARESLVGSAVYTRQHDMLAATTRNGNSGGIMEREVAEYFMCQFRSTEPLLVTAKVIKSLSRADHKRLEMVFAKKNADTLQDRIDAILKTQLNYYSDGIPPISVEQVNDEAKPPPASPAVRVRQCAVTELPVCLAVQCEQTQLVL